MLQAYAAAIAAIVMVPAAANAAVVVVPISDFDGEFGSFSKTVSGSFSFEFTFASPEDDGLISASVTSTTVGTRPPLAFTSILLNGEALTPIAGSDPLTQSFKIEDLFTSSATNVLTIIGSGKGSFGGSIAFQPVDDSGNPQPAVPEPASWAMMITGFGLVGGAMRRRSSVRMSYGI